MLHPFITMACMNGDVFRSHIVAVAVLEGVSPLLRVAITLRIKWMMLSLLQYIVICNFLPMPLQMLWVIILPQMLLSLQVTCSPLCPYSLPECGLFFWQSSCWLMLASIPSQDLKPGSILLSLSSKRNYWVTLFLNVLWSLCLSFDEKTCLLSWILWMTLLLTNIRA